MVYFWNWFSQILTEQQSLMKQAELRKSANLQPGQDVFGDTGRIRLLMLPALVKESNSNGGNIDQDIVMDNDLAYAQRLDPYWNEIIEYKQFHKLPQTRSRAAFVKTSSHMYKIDDRGILRRLYTLKKEAWMTLHLLSFQLHCMMKF